MFVYASTHMCTCLSQGFQLPATILKAMDAAIAWERSWEIDRIAASEALPTSDQSQNRLPLEYAKVHVVERAIDTEGPCQSVPGWGIRA